MFSSDNDALLDDICNHLSDSDCDSYFYDDKLISNEPLVYHPPPLDEVWLSEPQHCFYCHNLEECCQLAEDNVK